MRLPLSGRLATAAILFTMSTPIVARAQTVWDLVALGASGGALGISHTFTNGALGSVTGFVTNTVDDLYAKDFGQPLSDSEHGIGLCAAQATWHWNGTTYSPTTCATSDATDHEIGDYGSNGLVFAINLAAGNILTGFSLSSVQTGEGWKVFYETTGTCNASTTFAGASSFAGTGPTRGGNFVDQSTTAANCFKFVPNGGTGGADYLLETFTTAPDPQGGRLSLTPEPATLTMLATGLVGLVGGATRRKRRNVA